MDKVTLIFAAAFAIAVTGCDVRDESQPIFGAATESEPSTNSTAGTVSENTEGTQTTLNPIIDATGEATGAQGNNPGTVPAQLVAEVTSLDVSEIDAPRGHKIFAGNEIRGVLPGAELEVEYSYFNLDFPCVGDALFESYPSQLLAASSSSMLGGFVWEPIIPDSDTNVWNLRVGTILAGDEDHSILEDGIQVFPVNWGDIIVGSAIVNKLVVTRIVQYEECVAG